VGLSEGRDGLIKDQTPCRSIHPPIRHPNTYTTPHPCSPPAFPQPTHPQNTPTPTPTPQIQGMLHTRGAHALMVDADGATDITDLEKLYTRTQATERPCPSLGAPVAVGIGSRAHYEKDSVAQRAWYRTVLMKGLHVLVSVLISGRIRDTQCGEPCVCGVVAWVCVCVCVVVVGGRLFGFVVSIKAGEGGGKGNGDEAHVVIPRARLARRPSVDTSTHPHTHPPTQSSLAPLHHPTQPQRHTQPTQQPPPPLSFFTQASSSSPAGPCACSSAPSTSSAGASTSKSSTSATASTSPWWCVLSFFVVCFGFGVCFVGGCLMCVWMCVCVCVCRLWCRLWVCACVSPFLRQSTNPTKPPSLPQKNNHNHNHNQEVPVNWHEVAGSKLIQRKIDVVLASLGIFRDMLCVRLCYLLGVWTTHPYTRQGLGGDGGKGSSSSESPLRRSPRRRNKAE
jgi:hypothetical protein